MVWIDLASLGIGLGIGTVAGWWLKRSPASATSLPPRSEQGTPEPEFPPSANRLPSTADPKISLEQWQQTQLAYQMAREIAQFNAGFLARTSHELRSPLNTVISLHQLILADLCESPEEEREFVAQANTASQKMLNLLDQLIKVSKAIYGTEGLYLQALSLEDVLLEVQQFVTLQAKNRNLRLEIQFPEPDIEIFTDRNWLRQVLVSLIDTPLAQMQEGFVRVSTHADPATQQAQIWIEDERPAEYWTEAIDQMNSLPSPLSPPFAPGDLLHDPTKRQAQIAQQLEHLENLPSVGMSLLVNQLLLEAMNGTLAILALPDPNADPENSSTRIQCSVPLAPLAEAD